MDSTQAQHALAAAERAADAAAKVIAQFLASGEWQVSFKPDDSPVTEVDVAAEKAIHAVLSEAMPGVAFLGEETGAHDGEAHTAGAGGDTDAVGSIGAGDGLADTLRWLVDPIDGTKSFIRGSRYYSTQIALWDGQQVLLGVSHAPSYGERLSAVRGQGAWLNGMRVHCRDTESIEPAFLSSGNLARLAGDPAAWARYGALVARVRRVRGYGDFCHYHQLCCGQADLVIESDLNILDIAALSVAVEEAGGVITDLQGQAPDLATTSILAAATPALHAAAMHLLAEG